MKRQFPTIFPGFLGIMIPVKDQKEWDFYEKFNIGLAIFYMAGISIPAILMIYILLTTVVENHPK